MMALALQSFSQVIYPVTITNFQVRPSVFLSDYTEPGSQQISAMLVFNDHNEISRDVYLRLTIESPSVRLATSANFRPNTFTLFFGEPLLLQPEDFTQYFMLQNMDVQGISRRQLQRTGQLPEGWYTFTLEVLEFPSQRVISRATSVRVRLELKEPPRPTSPRRGELISSNVQQFNFQFMHPHPDINATNTSYVLRLYEIDQSERNPQLAIANRTARRIYESDPFRMLTYNYNLSHPALTPGMRYAYTITAIDDAGRPRFKNNGESEVFWFYFGFPTGGNIPLLLPRDGFAYTRFDIPTLSWGPADNIIDGSQPVIYRTRVVFIDEYEDTAGVMETNRSFIDVRSPVRFDRRGGFLQTPTLGHQQRYAWQVIAESDGTEIARSEIRTFTGPPLIESFFIENHEVFITNITDMNFDRFSGEGEFQIDRDGRRHRAQFENLRLVNHIGIFIVDSGAILTEAIGFPDIEMFPSEDYRNNLGATFRADSIRLCPAGLRVKGSVIWDFPFGVRHQNNPRLVSTPTWVNYTDFKLQGQLFLPRKQRFELLEPALFNMALYENSSFIVYDRTWTMNFSGHVEVNQNVRPRESETYRFPFFNFSQLFYNEITYQRPQEQIRLLSGADIFLQPRRIVLDLSDARSPGKFAADNTWRGIYIEEFYLYFAQNIDRSGQLRDFRRETLFYQKSESDATTAFIIGSGLHSRVTGNFAQDDPVHFYTFESELNNFNMEIVSGLFRSGEFRGRMHIPIICETEKFNWVLPMSDDGFLQGYLDEPTSRLSFIFAPNDPESRLNVTVQRAQFSGLDHLSTDLKIEFPYINTTLADLNDFRIYGNKDIGFGGRGGNLPLTHQRQTLYKEFNISLTSIGAGRICEEYVFGFRADIAMGDDISGGDGPPALNLFAFSTNTHLLGPCDKPVQDITTPEIFANRGEFEMSDEGVGECDGTSVADEIEAQNQAMREQIAMIEAAMDALDDIEIHVTLVYEDVGDLVIKTIEYYSEVELLEFPYIDESAITADLVIDLLEILLLLADEERSRQIEGLIQVIRSLQEKGTMLYEFYQELRSGALLMRIINDRVNQIVAYLTSPIDRTAEAAMNFVSAQVSNLQDRAITKFDDLLNVAFTPILEGINNLPFSNDMIRLGLTLAETSRNTFRNLTVNAIQSSVDENITGTINYFIGVSIRGSIVGFIENTIRENVNLLISGQAREISLSNITDNAREALDGMGEAAREFFSMETVWGMLVNTGNDILAEVNWQNIKSEIVSELFDPSSGAITQAIIGGAVDRLGDVLPLPSAIVDNIGLAFNMRKPSATDPVRIVFDTRVASGEGFVQLDTADPVFGRVWRGGINAVIKKPVEFGAFVYYVQGQTLGEDGFRFWFLEFGVDRLMLPLTPVPLFFTGGSGRVFQRMSQPVPLGPFVPDRYVNFGAGIRATFVDQTRGGILAMEAELGLRIMDGGFELGMNGRVDIANRINSAESRVERSLITGEGSMLFSSIDRSFFANATVTANTAPLLCAGGEFKAFISPDDWGLSVGTRENPFQARLLCRDFIRMGGWFQVNRTFLDLGLFQYVDIYPRSPWIGPRACQVQVWARFRYDFGLQTLVHWRPLSVREAAVWLDVLMGVGAHYRTPFRTGTITFASINFGGNLLFATTETSSSLSGSLYGRLRVLGIRINVEMGVNTDLASN